MQKGRNWIPLLTSVGVGVATYYTMARRNQKLGQAIQNIVPFVSSQIATSSGNKQQRKQATSS